MLIAEMMEGQVFRTRLTGRNGRVEGHHKLTGVLVTWIGEGRQTFVHHRCVVDPVVFVRPEDA